MKNISIYITLLLVQFCSLSLFAQEGKQLLTAKVVTEDNKPVAGVVVKSLTDPSSLSVMTGVDGVFTFEVSKNEALELTINSVDKMIVTPDKLEMTIVVNSQTKTIDYGFGIRHSQLESTASVSKVDFNTLAQSGEVNPGNTLFGRLLGLTVLENSTMDGGYPFAGGSPTFFIRGKGTNQTASPLVLVDGVPRQLVALSLDEIESVEVLKDAATLALYGQYGANGVLNVKTKRGNFNTPREVKVSYQYELLFPVRLPKMVDGVGYANAINEAMANDGITTPMYSDADIKDIREGNYPYLLPNVNWFDEALRSHGDRHIANVSFRGGGSNIAYFANINYSDEKGLYKPVNYNTGYSTQLSREMMSASTNLDIKVTKTTSVSVGMYANLAQFNRPGLTQDALFGYLYQLPATAFPVKAADGTWGGSSTYVNGSGISMNPVAQIASTGYAVNNQNRLGVEGLIKQDLSGVLSGLSADIRVGTDNVVENLDTKQIPNFLYTVSSYVRDPATGLIPDENITTRIDGAYTIMNLGGSLKSQFRHSFLYGKINYDKAWDRNVIQGSAGYTHEKSVGDGQYNTLLQEGLFAQAHYVRNQKYIVDLAMSYHGTNFLQKGDHYRFYPALSAGWIISRENFMKSNENLDLLKLRGSFGYSGNSLGLSGNSNVEQNLYLQQYTQGGGYTLGDANTNNVGRLEGKLGTPDMSPELSRTGNLGLDYSLWKKLSGSIDVFYSYRTRIIEDGNNSSSSVLGLAGPYLCRGIVSNKGGEIGVNWMDKKGDFTYLIGGQFSYARNKIINMEEAYKQYDYMKNTGQRVGQPFGLQAIGFFKDQEDIDTSVPQSWGAPRPGDVKYKDQNGDGKIDANDVIPLASPTGYPDMYFSLTLSLEWKGFGFNALFQGAAEYGVNLNTQGTYWGLYGNYTISQYMYDNSWTSSSTRSTPALFPRLTSQVNPNNYQNNSIWIIDDSFVKLRNLEVYYLLPKSLLSKMSVSSAKLSLRCSNVFSIDKLKISDPEFTGANMPLLSTYSLGLTFNF